MPKINRLLVIEDSDHKWERIKHVVNEVLGSGIEVVRAVDQISGEARVQEGRWDLLLLDMSLDIRRSENRPGEGGHDYTGGLKIAGRMYYLKKEIPTIIVTGFDAFPSGYAGQNQDVILGLEDVDRQAAKYLDGYLLGTVRYGPQGWEESLASYIMGYTRK